MFLVLSALVFRYFHNTKSDELFFIDRISAKYGKYIPTLTVAVFTAVGFMYVLINNINVADYYRDVIFQDFNTGLTIAFHGFLVLASMIIVGTKIKHKGDSVLYLALIYMTFFFNPFIYFLFPGTIDANVVSI
jgi:hypothetical protein